VQYADVLCAKGFGLLHDAKDTKTEDSIFHSNYQDILNTVDIRLQVVFNCRNVAL
jgi:hypothetical protein